jgi:hypothetical protein
MYSRPLSWPVLRAEDRVLNFMGLRLRFRGFRFEPLRKSLGYLLVLPPRLLLEESFFLEPALTETSGRSLPRTLAAGEV